jgi:hypothetical protein
MTHTNNNIGSILKENADLNMTSKHQAQSSAEGQAPTKKVNLQGI